MSAERAQKWATRADQWHRLAKLADEDEADTVASTCRQLGEQAEALAKFFRKWK